MRNNLLIAVALGFLLQLTLSWRLWAQEASEPPSPAEPAPELIGQTPRMHAGYSWRAIEGNPDQLALYLYGQQLGNYVVSSGFYYETPAGKRGGPRKSPVPPPFFNVPSGVDKTVFGVKKDPQAHGDRIWNGTHEITRGELDKLLTGDDLQDDSKAGHYTVVAKDPALVKKAGDDWERHVKANPKLRNVRAQFYDSGAKVNQLMLAPYKLDVDNEFNRSGVVVIAQAPADGKDGRSPPHRIYRYAGAETGEEALRNINPDWNPNLPKLPTIPGIPGMGEIGWLIAAVAVLAVVFVLAAIFH